MSPIGPVLLTVSLVSLTVYLLSLWRLLNQPRQRGLIRTAVCRIAGALLYTVTALATLLGHTSNGLVAFVAIAAVQLMWQANSVADVLLTRRVSRHKKVREE